MSSPARLSAVGYLALSVVTLVGLGIAEILRRAVPWAGAATYAMVVGAVLLATLGIGRIPDDEDEPSGGPGG